jgi:hypothetical protein
MFGNIATQIIGYYAIAALLIPLGYGHLKLRRWTRPFLLALLRSWLVVGLPLVVVFFFILVASKELSLIAIVTAAVFSVLSYLVAPGMLSRLYQSRNVRLTFETTDPEPCAIEEVPIPILALCFLYLFYALVLHVPIFFNGIFPFFGTLLFDLEGILLVAISILLLLLLAWGTLSSRIWAWWGALAYFGLVTFSAIFTFLRSSYFDILSNMRFPPTEMEILDEVPLQGFHLTIFFGIPLLATLVVIVLSKRYFNARSAALNQ